MLKNVNSLLDENENSFMTGLGKSLAKGLKLNNNLNIIHERRRK